MIELQKKVFLENRQRMQLLGIGGLTTLVFATILYALWSYVGAGFIENLGGKYFIPIFPLFFVAFYGVFTFKNTTILIFFQKIDSKIDDILGGGMFLTFAWAIVEILNRYYIF